MRGDAVKKLTEMDSDEVRDTILDFTAEHGPKQNMRENNLDSAERRKLPFCEVCWKGITNIDNAIQLHEYNVGPECARKLRKAGLL